MPIGLADPLTSDEPTTVTDPALPNPALDDSAIKAMAAKFADLMKPDPKPNDPAPTPPAPDTTPPAPKVQAAPQTAPPAPEQPDEIAEPKPNEPITREHFKRLAQSQKAFKEQAAKLKAEHEAALAREKALAEERDKLKAALPPNLEEVQKAIADSTRLAAEHKKLTEELEAVALERSPKFRQWWSTETGKHLKVAQAHVPADKRDEIAKLMMEEPSSERDAAIDSILEPLSSTAKRLATSALENIESLRVQRAEALEKSSERWKELQAHEAQQRDDERKAKEAKLKNMADQALARARNYSAFQPTGDTEHDSEIPRREAFVRAATSGKVDMDVLLSMPAISVEYLHLTEKVVPALKAELAKQSELIKQLQSGGARVGDATGGKSTSAQEPEDGTAFAAKVMANMRK